MIKLILIFTGNEQLDNELNKKIKDSRIVYYSEYVLEYKIINIILKTSYSKLEIKI